MRRYLCGTPYAECEGGLTGAPKGMYAAGKSTVKVHSSREDAFKCHVRYLARQGYKRVGSREFAPPGGGPILVLTRKSSFGASMRLGKTLEGRSKGSRVVPKKRGKKHPMGGLIVG